MPIGEIEVHPYLDLGVVHNATKLILGSFPVYECTDQDSDLKQQNRLNEGTVRFFYGSCDSSLWLKYRDYIDNNIDLPPVPENILDSLTHNQISISDTIISCERNGVSSLDTDLIRRTYNRHGIEQLIQNGVRKILCTSKGVLKDLECKIISNGNNPLGLIDEVASENFQMEFINNLNGNINQLKTPVSKVFSIGNCQVSALAIPSPGSPQSRLRDFGFNGDDWTLYADSYFENAFNWLNE